MIFFYNLNIHSFKFRTHYITERRKNHFDELVFDRNHISLMLNQRTGVDLYNLVETHIHFLQLNETVFLEKSFDDFYFPYLL